MTQEIDKKVLTIAGRECTFTGNSEDPYFQNLSAFYADLPPIAPYITANLPADAIILDVGANIGLTAVLMSLLVPNGQVFAFEAMPKTADYLRLNIEQNGISNCHVINKPVGAVPTVLKMTDSGAGSHIVTDVHMDKARRSTIDVPVITLDDFVLEEARLPRVDFVKMDVEGFEPSVLAGGRRFMQRFRSPVLMEFNSWSLRFAQGFDPFVFAASIFSHFDPGELRPDGSVVPVANGDLAGFLYENMVLKACVSDVLLRLPAGGIVPELDEMTKDPEVLRLRSEISALCAPIISGKSTTSDYVK